MNDKERLDNFVRASQYIARITGDQDFYAEVAGLVQCYFGASWAVFGCAGKNSGKVEVLFEPDGEEAVREEVHSPDFLKRMAVVMDTGIMDIVGDGPLSALLLPLGEHGVMVVGYPEGEVVPNEMMNLLLGVSGLVETVLERLKSEKALRENYDQLDALVRERTGELEEKNQLLTEEVKERLAIEAGLRESEERFKALFMRAPIAIYVYNAKTYDMIDANPRACESHECESVEELNAAELWLDPPYSFEEAKRWMQKADRKGTQLFEWCSRCKSGGLFWEQLQLVRIELSGTPCILVMASDITERKQAEIVLRESEERFRALAENLPLGMVMIDRERRIIHANHQIRKWFPQAEFDRSPLCYCSLHDPPLSAAGEECPVTRTLLTGDICSGERTTRIDGADRHLHLLSAPIRDADGKVIAAMEVLEDITERKEAEAEMERLHQQMRDAMRIEAHQAGKIETATGILHDIGNAISGMGAVLVEYREGDAWPETERLRLLLNMTRARRDELEEALGSGKGEAFCQYVERLIDLLNERAERQRSATDRAEAIISHISAILTMQRRYALSGAVDMNNRVYLGAMIDDAISMMSASMQKRHIQVERHYEPSSGHICGDQTALIQVFVNLIKNVCEAFDQDEAPARRMLRIEVTERQAESLCEVVVADNGCGFTREAHARLFERAYTTKPQGSGIGLPFVKGVMKSHGGRICMKSEGSGKGAVVILEFPMKTDGK